MLNSAATDGEDTRREEARPDDAAADAAVEEETGSPEIGDDSDDDLGDSDPSDVDSDSGPDLVSPVTSTDGVMATGGVEEDSSAGRRRRGRAWPILTVMLVLLLAALGYTAWDLWETTGAWQERADELTEANYELGQQVADLQGSLISLEAENDLIAEQLATSNQRLLDVAAENASIIDDQAYASQQLSSLAERLATAGAVANQLNRCIDGQQQLADYLSNPDDYGPDELASYRQSVDELCEAAESANSRLQDTLNR